MSPVLDAPVPATLFARAAATPDRVALRRKRLGGWEPITWRAYADQVARVAAGLRALGVAPGDRVAVQADNRPEWVVVDLAAQAVGAVVVGIDPAAAGPDLEAALRGTGPRVLVAEGEEQVDACLAARRRPKVLEHVVVVDPRGVDLSAGPLQALADLEELGRAGAAEVPAAAARLDLADPAVVLAPLGGGVAPQGEAPPRTHGQLLSAAAVVGNLLALDERSEVLASQPLAHGAERLVSVVAAVAHGCVVNFGEGPDTFVQDLREVQPTAFVGVPMVWAELMAASRDRLADAGWLKRRTYEHWARVGAAIVARRAGGVGTPSAVDRVRLAVGGALLYRPLRTKLGLLRARGAWWGSAGSAAGEVPDWFRALGVPVDPVPAPVLEELDG